MISVTLDRGQLHALELKLAVLGQDISPLLTKAAKQAVNYAKKTTRGRVKQMYTIDGSLTSGIKGVRTIGTGAELLIASPRKSIKHYKARQNKQGVFASVKRGSGGTIGRSFGYNGTFFRREGRSRLPIHALYGPAIPQLFQNPAVQREFETSGLNKYEELVGNELSKIIGG